MIACEFYMRDVWIYLVEMLFYFFLSLKLLAHPQNALIKAMAEQEKNTHFTENRIWKLLTYLCVIYFVLSFWGAIICIIQIEWMKYVVNILNIVTILSAIIAVLILGRKKI